MTLFGSSSVGGPGKGLGLGSDDRFNAAAVADTFRPDPNDVPVMLVTVGHPGPSNWPKKPRKPVHEVLTFA
jgi:hypothetical protein